MNLSEFIHTFNVMLKSTGDMEAKVLVEGKPINSIVFHMDSDGNFVVNFTSKGADDGTDKTN